VAYSIATDDRTDIKDTVQLHIFIQDVNNEDFQLMELLVEVVSVKEKQELAKFSLIGKHFK
jgi:hypothetical protein